MSMYVDIDFKIPPGYSLPVAQSIRRKGFVDDKPHGRFPGLRELEAPGKALPRRDHNVCLVV